ncbi:MAG: DUF2092 domain-containing protein [Pseudomonadota bacterium]
MKIAFARGPLLALALAVPAAAQDDPPTPAALMQSMAEALAGAESFSFHVEKTFDDVLLDGAIIELGGGIDVAAARPGSLYVSYGGDTASKQAWVADGVLTLVDHRARVVGTVAAEGDLDAALDDVAARHDLRMPLADLISSDLPERLAGLDAQAIYVGLHDVEGAPSHHVLLRGTERDAQLWIDAGETPVLNKLVITDIALPGRPRTAFVFSEWSLEARFPDGLFDPDTPEGYASAAFLPAQGD